MKKARKKDYDELKRKDSTSIIEKPIEQILLNDLRYIDEQPANKPEVFDWDNYNL